MPDRYFNRREAEELLPVIGKCLEEARACKQKVEACDLDISRTAAQIMVLGGSIPPFDSLAEIRALRERSVTALQEQVSRIQQTGCQVKDLDEGLVDFPSLMKGQEVLLCWKLGEERVLYWHGLEEGFAGRKPLDDTPGDTSPGGTTPVQ
ncbi:MAG TPA: DUF2203 domain-containing protein [Candidatus Polarisedimenticolia bacterium]|nr:DUF2203 domain-containing protein [Candidatus Polarisedimenticolia bacterium]